MLCPQSQCINGLIIVPNHAPLEIILELEEPRGDSRFHFEKMWFERDNCFDIIRTAWGSVVQARELESLKQKLSTCKLSLIEWSKREFKHNVMEISKVKRQLRNLGDRSLNDDELDKQRALKSSLDAPWKMEEIYWKHRSRVKWLTQGDKNTKYFHQTTLARRRTNKIVCIRGSYGTWIQGEKEV